MTRTKKPSRATNGSYTIIIAKTSPEGRRFIADAERIFRSVLHRQQWKEPDLITLAQMIGSTVYKYKVNRPTAKSASQFEDDAADILENTLNRKRWSATDRDNLADALYSVYCREKKFQDLR
ncbi:hypothetical protein D2T29_12645 [Sinirhodobacter populi]|uniref:Uncharacterized protein n=1 Tax=Paenirhodobacter populi TaxID=2306993 RepID=A0A443KD37_9RHOB|nr:hypothetical protein [Sinirhodobacter populi]RWR30513.1 hypothetical protein D2T29_12645 [Sinirhodobacter populi]